MDVQKCKKCGNIAKIVDYKINPRNKKTIATFRCHSCGHEFQKGI